MSTEASLPHSDALAAGYAALERGDWEEARARFQAALAAEESAEAFEGLGMAAFWCEDAAATIEARERAYRLYRARGDRAASARVAVCLADDFFSFRGEDAVANGWLQRARRLLDGLPLAPEHGMLAAQAGYYALMGRHDPIAAGRYGAEAAACGRALGVVDVEMHGLALEGLALVSQGQVEQGMTYLDEATAAATGGEMIDAAAIGMTCCYLIYACEWVRDYPRAAQWCERLREYCERLRFGSLLAVCRTHYAGVLIWRGEWGEAEQQLTTAITQLTAMRPPLAVEGLVRFAELRRRQGRWEEAEQLLREAEHHPQALLARAALDLDRGDAAGARDWAGRFLRRLPPDARTERAAALEVLVRAHLHLGDHEAAAATAAELQQVANAIGTKPLHAATLAAEGLLAAAAGDHAAARRYLEDAADLYEHSGAPFESACARLDLAASLRALGRLDQAAHEADRATATLRRIGARRREEGGVMMHDTGASPSAPSPGAHPSPLAAGLTGREVEVLRLLARGLSNQEIAAELVLSVRTVERHISTIYEKLGVRGKVARATASVFAIRHGLS